MATNQSLKTLVDTKITQQNSIDRITATRVREVNKAIIDEISLRGLKTIALITDLATLTLAETKYVFCEQNKSILRAVSSGAVDNILIFQGAGTLWELILDTNVLVFAPKFILNQDGEVDLLFKTVGGQSILGIGDIPSGGNGGSQTPFLQNIDAAQFGINNLKKIEIKVVVSSAENRALSSRDLANAAYWDLNSNISSSPTTEDGTIAADTLYLLTGQNGGINNFHQDITVEPNTTYHWYMDVKRNTNTDHIFHVFNLNSFTDITPQTNIFSDTSNTVQRVGYTFTTPVGCTIVRLFIVRNLVGSVYIGDVQLTKVEGAPYVVTQGVPVAGGGGTANVFITDDGGNIIAGNIQNYADNAAALSAGKTAGMLYHTGGVVKIVI